MSKFEVDGYAESRFGIQLGPMSLTTHNPDRCSGEYCVVHNPSEHKMREWPTNYRADVGIMERICSHGVGHPDPDDVAHQIRMDPENGHYANVHGCCGCCNLSLE